ncbi:MAG: ROK family protein [Cyclobacteriaceae bacterium]
MKQVEFIGVDIGGSHISAGKVDFENFPVPDPQIWRKPVNSLGNEREILDAWIACLQKVVGPLSRLGIAMPAPFDYPNGISLLKDQGKFVSLYNKNLKKILSERLLLPEEFFIFINDAAAYLQGEALAGGWKEEDRLMGLTLGTGLGSAFKTGKKAEDAELWSSPFKGKIAEDYLGSSYFVRWAKDQLNLKVTGLKELLDNPATYLPTLNELKIFGANLGEFISLHISKNQIRHVIIGGNMANAASLFLPQTKEFLNNEGLFPDIRVSQLGEKAAMIGAASVSR